MKVHLIRKQSIETYIDNHPESKHSFIRWLALVKYSDWKKPDDIKYTFSSADLLGKSSNLL
jgi:mRNA interferase HigB